MPSAEVIHSIAISPTIIAQARLLARAPLEALGQQLEGDEEDHRAAGEPETERQQRLEDRHEHEGRHRGQRLGNAREDRVAGAFRDRDAARAQRHRDGNALGDIVHRNGRREQQAEAELPGRVADAHRDPLGDAVDEHRDDHHDALPRLRRAERADRPLVAVHEARRPREERRAGEQADHHLPERAGSAAPRRRA